MASHEAGLCRQQGCVYLLSSNNFQVGKPEDGVMGTMGYHKFYKATEAEYEEYFYEQCTQCEEEQGLVASETEICLHCRHLRLRHFFVCTSLPGERYRSLRLRLGNLEELRQRSENCVFCNLICAAVETQCIAAKDLLEERLDNMFPELYSTERSVYLSRNRRTEIVYAKSFLGENARGIQKVDSTPLTVHIETFTTTPQASLSKEGLRKAAVSIDRTLSWEKVKGWLEECDSKHQHETQLEKASEIILPPGFMVLDVKNKCIVDGTPDCRYIALSYVWGAFQPGDLATTKSTIDFLKKPASLNKETVPATIWDSLAVCQELDVPFLWVDRLCIVQDGEAQKMEQINGMDAIYSRAYITICAVGGAHSRAGLCGTTNTPRSLQQGFVRIGNLGLVTELPDTRVWRGEAWWKRGWTYQEYVLSGRSLLFTPWQVSFECAAGVLFEGPTNEMSIGDWEHPINSTTFDRYEGIVREYNNRILSWQSDVYNGFIGVFKSLYRNLDQFIYGLPAVDFDKAILWDTETLLDGMIPRYTENNWLRSKLRKESARSACFVHQMATS
ncbi:hypothetical protein SLS56_011140 [Neofusicoccum ribis]|uniref:Heterokaryon incompatibility domain-containing protein n=1 Tax=Neofusicoccum ribis TaxID=45134 RepID=A0ABR3SCD7_9PEZI